MSESLDAVVVGGGPAGLAAARALRARGAGRVVVLEREAHLGGIPRHCVHQGFGLRDLHRMVSGPRYASRLVALTRLAGVELRRSTTVTSVDGGGVEVTSARGLERLDARAVILATGARERPRPARLVPGDRAPGVFTTGQLQTWSIAGDLPVGRRALVVGAELVSYSAVLTLHHAGVEVVAMTTEHERHQALRGTAAAFRARYRTALLASTRVVEVVGRGRVRSVVVEEVATGRQRALEVDTVVFTGSWVPDHELAHRAGVEIDSGTRGPATDVRGRTSVAGLFAAGNLIHPVETADVAAVRGAAIGDAVGRALASRRPPQDIALRVVQAGTGLEWVWPNRVDADHLPAQLSLRASDFRPRATLVAVADGRDGGAHPLRGVVPNRHLVAPGAVLEHPGQGAVSLEIRERTTRAPAI